jgi:hypothetical protein
MPPKIRRAFDYINLYSCASYSVWRSGNCSNNSLYFPGIKHEIGHESGGCWETQDNDSINKYLVTGPDYFQRAKYQETIPLYSYHNINYQVDFQLKIKGDTTAMVPVCELSVYNNDDSTVLASRVLFARDMSNSFARYSLAYIINRKGSENKKDYPANTDTGYKPQGTSFRIKWLGNRKLAADSIAVYDDILGAAFVNPAQLKILTDRAKNFSLSFRNANNINIGRYLDNPADLDSYLPYKIITDALQYWKHQGKNPNFTISRGAEQKSR